MSWWFRGKKPPRRRPVRRRARSWSTRVPALEWLEDRVLLSGGTLATATPLTFGPQDTAQATQFLARPREADLYEVVLGAGDRVTAAVSAQAAGSGLTSLLRVFDAQGNPLALDDQLGGDPSLTFQAPAAGDYFVGVSSAPNDNYDPRVPDSGTAGGTTGLYTLNLRVTPGAAPAADLAGSSFRLGADTASPGDLVPVAFTVENRGAIDPGNFQVEVLLAANGVFDNASQLVATLQRTDLVTDPTGRTFSAPPGFAIAIPPDQVPGPLSVGLRIVPDPAVPDAGTADTSGAHLGADWERLTVVVPVTPDGGNHAQGNAQLIPENAAVTASLAPGSADWYELSLPENGNLTAQLLPVGGSGAGLRLTLYGASGGQVLATADAGPDGGAVLRQHVPPGEPVYLAVSGGAAPAGYRLVTQFTAAEPPLDDIDLGSGPDSVAVADVNGDGIPDLLVANQYTDTVGVLLGQGNGLFGTERDFDVGDAPSSVAVADVNGDGKPDLIVTNRYDNTVSVLLGNGDGSFQPQQTFPVGNRPTLPDNFLEDLADMGLLQTIAPGGAPTAVAVADVNGDGKPDLIVANSYVDNYDAAAAGSVSVLLGNGDGTFQPQQVFPVGSSPSSVAVADVNGDGNKDIITANRGDGTVSVLLGNGDGSFLGQQTYTVGGVPASVAVADVNRDNVPDLIVANSQDNTVSVLLGKGDGSFQPQRTFVVGTQPASVVVADVNGDGIPDLVVADRGAGTLSVLPGNGDGTFGPGRSLAVGKEPVAVAVADVNGDGHADLIATNFQSSTVSVLPGNGDGTFSTQLTSAVGGQPQAAVVTDLNGDGIPDVVTALAGNAAVGVMLGLGDGSFAPAQIFPAVPSPQALVVADVNGDGIPDLVVASADGQVGVLLGEGGGSFGPVQEFAAGSAPSALAVADVNGDGIPDLVVADKGGKTVSVLLGKGDGTFQPGQPFAVGTNPSAVAVADVNGDGIPDLLVANYHDNTVSVLLGKGDGSFGPQQTFSTYQGPCSLLVGDLNGDGKPDVVVSNNLDDVAEVFLGNGDGTFRQQAQAVPLVGFVRALADVNGDGVLDLVVQDALGGVTSVFPGRGDGTFAAPESFPADRATDGALVADVNGDGRPDLIALDSVDNRLLVLPGNGDGSFRAPQTFATGAGPAAVAVADINGDGHPDIVTANYAGDTVSVLRGDGDAYASFEPPLNTPTGERPAALAVADLNGDGLPDVVVANSSYDDNTIGVLLSNGDGTFQKQVAYRSTGVMPSSVAVADLNGDGKPDIVVANRAYVTENGRQVASLTLLFNQGAGAFGSPVELPVNGLPYAVAVADVNGDGIPDLIVTNHAYDSPAGSTVGVLLGKGNGTFGPEQEYGLGGMAYAVAVADVNGDGKPDIVVADAGYNAVEVLLNDGKGSFTQAERLPVGAAPSAVAVADVNDDGKPDILVANRADSTVGVLLGNGDGTFQPMKSIPVAAGPAALAVADINGDGIPDLVVAGSQANAVTVLLGNGDGTFEEAGADSAVPSRNTPYLANLLGHTDGTQDSVILDRSGNILVRRGLPGGQFAPPVVINPGNPARDIAVVRTGTGYAIAAADTAFQITPSGGLLYTVSLYTANADGSFSRSVALTTSAVPAFLAAGDLSGSGRDDLAFADPVNDTVTISLQTAPGQFGTPLTLPVGDTPSYVGIADVNGDGLPDVLAVDQASGDVAVLYNDPDHTFAASARFRTDAGTYQLDDTGTAASRAEPVSLAVGDFTGSGGTDLVLVNRGAHDLTLLPADGSGGFEAPQPAGTVSTSDQLNVNDQPGPVVSADFNRDGRPDLAVLMEDQGEVWIYTNEGGGTFRHTFSIPVGSLPSGLSVVPGGGPGLFDLLVGNQFGDVLRLVGNGDGTFQPPPPFAGTRAPLDVTTVDGKPDVLIADQAHGGVTVDAPGSTETQFAPVRPLAPGKGISQQAPGAVAWEKLDKGSGLADAVVMGTGSNNVLVYHTTGIDPATGQPIFAPPTSYDVGTQPVGITVADVNGDGVPDMLVADQGSNDVTILFGSWDANGDWVGTPGPRLGSFGSGPVATTLRDMNGDGIPDLVITNGGSGTLTVLPGVGGGFFNDQHPETLSIPGNPTVGSPTFVGTSGLGFVTTADGRLVEFNLDSFNTTVRTVFTPPAGEGVAAAQALPSGNVVVALQGGGVEELGQAANSGQFTPLETFTPLSGIPSDPSALAVLQGSTSEVLVTNQGESDLFVFGVSSTGTSSGVTGSEPESIDLPGQTVAETPVAETSASGDAPLAVVVTLVADVLPSDESAGEGSTGQGPAVETVESSSDVVVVNVNPAGDEDDPDGAADTPADVPGDASDFRLGLDEVLRQLDLYRKVDDDRPFGDLLRGGVSEVLVPCRDVLADGWRALGEGLTPVAEAAGFRPDLPAPVGTAASPAETGDAQPAPATVAAVQPETPPHEAAPALQEGREAPAVERVLSPEETTAADAVDRAAEVLASVGVPDWGQTVLAALAAGGAAAWVEGACPPEPDESGRPKSRLRRG